MGCPKNWTRFKHNRLCFWCSRLFTVGDIDDSGRKPKIKSDSVNAQAILCQGWGRYSGTRLARYSMPINRKLYTTWTSKTTPVAFVRLYGCMDLPTDPLGINWSVPRNEGKRMKSCLTGWIGMVFKCNKVDLWNAKTSCNQQFKQECHHEIR